MCKLLSQLGLVAGCLVCFGFTADVLGEGPPTDQSIQLEVVIADLSGVESIEGGVTAGAILGLEEEGRLPGFQRIHVATLDGHQCSVQFGGQAAVAQSRGGFGPGRSPVTSYTFQPIGTLVHLTPNIEEDGRVLVEVSIERSQIEKRSAAESVENADEDPLPLSTEVLNIKSRVRLKPGEPTIVSGRKASSAGDASQTWIVMTARVEADKPAEADQASRSTDKPAAGRSATSRRRDAAEHQAVPPAAAEARPLPRGLAARGAAAGAAQEVKVYSLQHASAANIASVLKEVFATEPVRIAADARVNSVIVTGPRRSLNMVEPLVQRLDTQP